MERMETRNTIIGLLSGTGRPGMDNVISFLKEGNFFSAQCHRHHKYPGGLADHSLEAYHAASRWNGPLPDDSLRIVCLLHDICSSRGAGSNGIHGHGRRSVAILENVCRLELKPEERDAILLHMHPFTLVSRGNRLGATLCRADSWSASRG